MEKGEKVWISIDLPDKTAGLKIKKEKKRVSVGFSEAASSSQRGFCDGEAVWVTVSLSRQHSRVRLLHSEEQLG